MIQTADRLNNVQEYYFSKKLAQIQAMRDRGIDVINLGIGDPDLPPPTTAIQAATAAIQQENNHSYAPYRSSPELRVAMKNWYRSSWRVDLDEHREILPLLGSKEGILYLSMALLNPGDSVLIPNPGYPAYASVARLLGVDVIEYDLTEEQDWLPNLDALKKKNLSRCKLMWVNYPHMPTGKVADLNFFAQLISFAKNHHILVCNDNPYGLVLNNDQPLSILKADPLKEVSCELNSLSKSFNMAGWRVGMLMGSSDVVDAVLQVKSNVDSGMFIPVQKGAIEALKIAPEWHQARNQIYLQRRKLIWQIFDHLRFRYQSDRVGLFVWGKVPEQIPVVANYLDQILEQVHVFLTPGMIFGSNGDRYVRASLCAPEETLREALGRIKKFYR